MARSRTWRLGLNLDEFNAAFAALGDDPERSHFLAGLSRGMNGGSQRDGVNTSFSEGFTLGQSMRKEAESFRELKTKTGSLGGRPPKEDQDITKSEPNDNQEVTKSEPNDNQEVTKSKPNDNPSHKPLAFNPLNDNPKVKDAPSASLPGFDLVLQKPLSRKEKKKKKLEAFQDETVDLVSSLTAKWFTQRQGKPIYNDEACACSKIEKILNEYGDVTLSMLGKAAEEWLDFQQQKPEAERYPNAIQYFFGSAPDAPWRIEIQALKYQESHNANV